MVFNGEGENDMDVVRQRKNAIMAYLVYVAVFYAILICKVEPVATYTSTFGLIGHLLTFPLYWIGLKIHTGEKRWPWVWFSVTGVLYFLGDFFWAYYEDWLGVEIAVDLRRLLFAELLYLLLRVHLLYAPDQGIAHGNYPHGNPHIRPCHRQPAVPFYYCSPDH